MEGEFCDGRTNDERMRFVIRLKDGETMASLCREFGISRKTGYKIFERYQQCGLEGLSDRVRRPFRYAKQLPAQVEAAIEALGMVAAVRNLRGADPSRPSPTERPA
jgi:transposase